jgi:preprotein translocase subunit SecY|tara:strand:- start:323 stop:1849 length:1527 start_codon:yes stop_codon:yes gene_type:complete
MISAFFNSFKIPELRDKIFITLFLLFIARMGANIPLPGLDPSPLQDYFKAQSESGQGGMLSLYNMFTGGALAQGALFTLGIMPYISASIIFQLLGAAVPSLARLQQEGETGRQKIAQYTRYATVVICLIQASLMVGSMLNPGKVFQGYSVENYGAIVITDPMWFSITAVIFLTGGTVLLMWIGEQITSRGIGNGISLLITIGILSDLPGALSLTYGLFQRPDAATDPILRWEMGIVMLAFLVLVVAGVVMIVQAVRRIPVQHAKRVVGRKVFGGQSSFLPLKVNYSGVMPIIFGSAILMFFVTIFPPLGNLLGNENWFGRAVIAFGNLFNPGAWTYYLFFGTLIFGFSYVWVSMMFKPTQIADDLKKNGGYVPGVRPGEPTAKYLDFIMTRLTFAGAIFLVFIAILPNMVSGALGIPYKAAQFFGGTGLLIIVGVLLDLLRQIETYLLQRHYDGFLKKGRIRGKSVGRTRNLVDTTGISETKPAWRWLALMFVSGLVAWVITTFDLVG